MLNKIKTRKILNYLIIGISLFYLLNIIRFNLKLKNKSSVARELKDSKQEFDSHCDQYGNWSSINRNIYFKKEASFYFIDVGLISLNLLHETRLKLKFKFKLNIHLNTDGFSYSFAQIIELFSLNNVKRDTHDRKYSFSTIDIKFHLNNFLSEKNFTININKTGLKMSINIVELDTHKIDINPLSLRIKKTNSGKKIRV